MTLEEIERLASRCVASGIGEIALSEPGFSLRLRLMPIVATQPLAEDGSLGAPRPEWVRAPGVGVFRSVHPTTGHAVAAPGQKVRKGDTVGVLQIETRLKAVVAPVDGVLGRALVEDGTVVGYGTPLYDLQ